MAALQLQAVNEEVSDLEDDFPGPDSGRETGEEVWNLRIVRFFNMIKLLNFKLKIKILFLNLIKITLLALILRLAFFFE